MLIEAVMIHFYLSCVISMKPLCESARKCFGVSYRDFRMLERHFVHLNHNRRGDLTKIAASANW